MQGTLFGEQEPKVIQPKQSNASNVILFPWGQYSGKSVEQVAVDDYQYLRFLERKNAMGDNVLRERIQKVLYNFNHFVSPLKCKAPSCERNATHLTIAKTYGHIPRGGNRVVEGITGLSVSPDYVWCQNHCDVHLYEKAIPHEIKFDTILQMPDFPKWVRKEVTDNLLICTGFTGKKTKQNLADLVDNLQLRNP